MPAAARHVLATLLVGGLIGTACGGSNAASSEATGATPPATDASIVAPLDGPGATTVESYVADTAVRWGLTLAEVERECLVETLVAELNAPRDAAIDEDWLTDAAPIRVPFYFVSCGVDVTDVSSDVADPTPLDVIIGALLTDENVLPTLDEIDCVERGLLDAFGASGLTALLGGSDEPNDRDDATAVEVFDACGLDGDEIVGG